MKTSYKILKSCSNCFLILTVLSLLFFSLFMSHAQSLNTVNSEAERIISCKSENVQEGQNFESFGAVSEKLPAPSQRIDNLYKYNFILNDLDEESGVNNEQIKPMCDNVSVGSNANRLARKYFVIQSISKEKLPTQRALRSDVLLI